MAHLELSSAEKQLRSNIRNFLLTATQKEALKEIEISLEREDFTRALLIVDTLRLYYEE